ncbi:hypothetical protein [Kingella potus]|nr:hypothetical protein [Kingella potus]
MVCRRKRKTADYIGGCGFGKRYRPSENLSDGLLFNIWAAA